MVNKIIIILLFAHVYTTNTFGNNHLISNKSISQQEYRRNFIKHNNINYLLELTTEELKILIPQLTNLKNKTKYQKKILLILKLLYYSKGIRAINKHDKNVISEYIFSIKQKNNSDLLPQIKILFTGKNSKFIKKMLKIENFLKKNNKSRMIKYQTYNYLGPFIETYKTICSFPDNFTDKQIFYSLKKKKNCKIKQKLFKNLNITDLLNKIEYGDKQIVKNYNITTPFVAKIILTEIILNKLNKKEQKNFFSQLINKTDYSEFTCGKFCNQKEPHIKRNINFLIPHNGYQLLNSIKGADVIDKYSYLLLEKNSKNIKIKHSPQTAGIECSLFLQRAIERSKLGKIKGRMKTDYMEYSLVKSKIARKYILNTENQLKTGDIVKLHGHTYLFIGYKMIKNHYYAVTIEAVGGNLRSVGIFYRDFYKEEIGSFNRKKDKNGKITGVSKNERYFIYRLR